MPCQSLGSMSRFWSTTRRTQLDANRRGSITSREEIDNISSGASTSEEKEQQEGGSIATQPHVTSATAAVDEEQQSATRTVMKTAADADYSWLPVGVALRVEQ
jgi:hypothetical protein